MLEHRQAAIDLDVPGLGPSAVLAPPFVIDGARRLTTTPPPALGEHGGEVLAEWLGYSDTQLKDADAAGAFGGPLPGKANG